MKVISSLHFGGAETQVIGLSRELAKQGHEVSLISLSDDVPRLNELAGSGVEVIVENKKSKLDLSVIRRLRNHIKNWKPDVVHGYLYDAEFYCRLAGFQLSVPIINSERNDNYIFNNNQIIGDFLTSWLVDGVIANSYAGMEFAKKRYKHLKPEKFHVVWNGIDLEAIARKTSTGKSFYKQEFFGESDIKLACMVATIKEQKNYELALQVAESLLDSGNEWRVVFIGDKLVESNNDYKNRIHALHSQSRHKDKIKFLGSRSDVLEVLGQADISFLTSHYEGFPNVALESMGVGTPVITTAFSDIRMIALHDWMVIAEKDPTRFIEAIHRAMEMKEHLSAQSKLWVANNCNIDVVSRKLLSIYQGFIKH